MIDIIAGEKRETALLVGVKPDNETLDVINEQLAELAELVSCIGFTPLHPEVAVLRGVHPQYLIGSGRAAEIARVAQECEADLVVFDCRLTPSQQRNWERLAKCPVIDREEVILDIFAARAHTREAVLQVELARAQYYLPRLTRAWTHLSRQRGGGATTRGEGEAQIETDRRLLRRRIQQMREELRQVVRHRDVQRKARLRRPVPQGAIVGYTNVGKSSLLSSLSGADLLVKDQLFATLDPTARRVMLEGHVEVVLSDTVGFVRNLPHSLIEAFKSTLEEAVLADFLILVLDVSSPRLDNEWETTLSVLRELGAEDKKIQVVFNKVDLLTPGQDAMKLARLHGLFPNALYISTKTGAGMAELRRRLVELAGVERRTARVLLPPERHDLIALAHSDGAVYEEQYAEDGSLEMVFAIDARHYHKFSEYLI